jgi:hypothetical protein
MAQIRRRPFPREGAIENAGKRGTAKGGNHRGKTGASGRGNLPNKPRKD